MYTKVALKMGLLRDATDLKDNSIIVLIKHQGRVWAQGETYDPEDFEEAMRKTRILSYSLRRTMAAKVFNKDITQIAEEVLDGKKDS